MKILSINYRCIIGAAIIMLCYVNQQAQKKHTSGELVCLDGGYLS